MIPFKTTKLVCRNRFMYPLILAVFLFAFTMSPALAELTFESVYPNQGVLGQDLAVTLKGTGFDENTRVFMTLDVGNKKAIISSVDTPDYAYGVAIVGDMAYVADFSSLQVIDVSSPYSPQIIGPVATPSEAAYGVTVVGDTAYMVNGGLHVIDIGNPADPQIMGFVATPGGAYKVCRLYEWKKYSFLSGSDFSYV